MPLRDNYLTLSSAQSVLSTGSTASNTPFDTGNFVSVRVRPVAVPDDQQEYDGVQARTGPEEILLPGLYQLRYVGRDCRHVPDHRAPVGSHVGRCRLDLDLQPGEHRQARSHGERHPTSVQDTDPRGRWRQRQALPQGSVHHREQRDGAHQIQARLRAEHVLGK